MNPIESGSAPNAAEVGTPVNVIEEHARLYRDWNNLSDEEKLGPERWTIGGWNRAPLEALPDHFNKILVPPQLFFSVEDPAKVDIIRSRDYIGRNFDDEWRPSLNITIIERNAIEPISEQEDVSNGKANWWNMGLNDRRRGMINRGSMTSTDRILLSLIATQDSYTRGIGIWSLVIASHLQGQGIGQAFYDRFEEILSSMGYDYLYGGNESSNIGFFLKRGRYLMNQTNRDFFPDADEKKYDPVMYVKDSGQSTVQFLNPVVEDHAVKPEFKRD